MKSNQCIFLNSRKKVELFYLLLAEAPDWDTGWLEVTSLAVVTGAKLMVQDEWDRDMRSAGGDASSAFARALLGRRSVTGDKSAKDTQSKKETVFYQYAFMEDEKADVQALQHNKTVNTTSFAEKIAQCAYNSPKRSPSIGTYQAH